MRLMHDSLGLFADFNGNSNLLQIYWKHTAMEAKALIVDGLGPIYARVESDGFLGMYQTESAPVDVMAFATFNRGVSRLRRLRLDPDGNLRGHFWNFTNWATEFEAIGDSCELPSACGPYGLCRAGKGCSCLDERTRFSTPGSCSRSGTADLCSQPGTSYWVMEPTGVDLPYKELMGFGKMGSLEECKASCMGNCSCWGAVFSNVSGFCYYVAYRIQTLVAVGDSTKVGFFKVSSVREEELEVGLKVGAILGVVAVGILGGGLLGFGLWWWKSRMGRKGGDGFGGWIDEVGDSPGPYRHLKETSRSIELCPR